MSQDVEQTDQADRGDLSVTALYTSQAWVWGRLPGARLFETHAGRGVFASTNVALLVGRLFSWGRRQPWLWHGLVQRHLAIDKLLADSAAAQVLELAAGFSRRGATVSADPAIQYTEVDLPAVIERKRALLARRPEGREVAARGNLRLVPADVAEIEVGDLLDPGAPAFVISEGLLMYLEAPAQRSLWARVARQLNAGAGGTYVFDLVPTSEQPPPGVFGRALGWLMRRFTRGAEFAVDARTRADIRAELLAAGFDAVSLIDTADVAAAWGLPFVGRDTQQLLFVCDVGPTSGRRERLDPPTDLDR